MGKVVDKTVTLELVGLDSSAGSVLGAFQRQARKEGWTQDEIKKVLDEAKSGDYNNLLATIMEHCESPEEDEDDEDYEDWDDDEDGDEYGDEQWEDYERVYDDEG